MARGFSAYPRLSYSKRDFAWEWECYKEQKKQDKKAIEEREVEVDECNIGDVDYLKDDEGYVYDIKTEDTVGKFDFNLDVWLFIYRPKELEMFALTEQIQEYYVEW